MNKQEKVDYIKETENYIEEKQLSELFEKLTKDLVIAQPDDPIQFLIDQLNQNVKSKKFYFINSINQQKLNEISDHLSLEFNMKLLNFEQIINHDQQEADQILKDRQNIVLTVNDKTANRLFDEQVSKIGNHVKLVLVSGYPSTLNQMTHLQKKGILQERFFLLNDADEKSTIAKLVKENCNKEDQETVELLQNLHHINLKDLKNLCSNEFYTEYDGGLSNEVILKRIQNIIKIVDKKKFPLRPPRLLIIRPPHSGNQAKDLVQLLNEQIDICPITIMDSINQQIDKKSQVGLYCLQSIQRQQDIPDDIVCSLSYTQLSKLKSRTYGWALEGFPRNQTQLKKFQGMNINPHIVVVFEDSDENLTKTMSKLPSQQISYKINQYKELVKSLDQIYPAHKIFKFKIGNFTNENLLKEILNKLNDSQIFY